jgi:hypothetical protein
MQKCAHREVFTWPRPVLGGSTQDFFLKGQYRLCFGLFEKEKKKW